MNTRILLVTIWYAWLAGCSVNPVTGDRELILVSSDQEIEIGVQNYAPMQQSQGGPYDVDPDLTAYVRSIGERLAAASEVSLPYEFVVLNNSVPNAWALPGGKIAINRGLLTELRSEAELAAVIGHEIVHAAARHSAQQLSRGLLMQGLVIATSIATSDRSYGELAVGGASVAVQLTMLKYSRDAELESDKYGTRYMSRAGYDPQGAVALQETFVRLSDDRNQSWLDGLLASHPPSQERVDENKETASKLPAGGEMGVDRFKVAMQRTMAAKPAYDVYDKGRKALADKDSDVALAHANNALALYPDEAHFHALRGDVRLIAEQFEMAVTNYSRAINRRAEFFYYHLQRGLAKYKLGQSTAAMEDLENSLEMFATALAHLTLAEIKEDRGSLNEAINHYKVVAKSGGEYGETAYKDLVRLELPLQPASYLSAYCREDDSAQIVVQVRNDTRVTITGIQAQIQYVANDGAQRRKAQNFIGRIAPGKSVSVKTGLIPYAATKCVATVTAAQVAM